MTLNVELNVPFAIPQLDAFTKTIDRVVGDTNFTTTLNLSDRNRSVYSGILQLDLASEGYIGDLEDFSEVEVEENGQSGLVVDICNFTLNQGYERLYLPSDFPKDAISSLATWQGRSAILNDYHDIKTYFRLPKGTCYDEKTENHTPEFPFYLNIRTQQGARFYDPGAYSIDEGIPHFQHLNQVYPADTPVQTNMLGSLIIHTTQITSTTLMFQEMEKYVAQKEQTHLC
jgi:hypothetical protein